MKQKYWWAASALAASALLAGQAVAATIVVDTFDTDQRVQDSPSSTSPTSSEAFADEAIGDYRDLSVSNNAAGVAEAATSLDVRSSNLTFNNEDGFQGTGTVVYDGVGGGAGAINTAGLGGVDFLNGAGVGAGFIFDVVRVDANLQITIDVFDIFGGISTFSAPTVAAGTPFVPLAAFVGDADFNSVGALSFTAQANQISLDGAINSIVVETGVVPIPASVALLLGGLGSFAAIGARRRRKQG